MIPSMDVHGKLILSAKNELFKNPDGHGGSLTAMHTSGALAELKNRGIETISYFQVDNPTVNIIDPVFIGFHLLKKANVSSKALIKAYPEEKIGAFVEFTGNRIGVVEYSDLPKEKMVQVEPDGSLTYAAGSIAIHIFEREFIEKITSGHSVSLPFHVARKKIKSITPAGEKEIDGFKFEKFVFDALPLSSHNNIVETIREEEFAPVKNKTGIDSVESSQQLMSDLYRSWLSAAGVKIPAKVKVVEISPLFAVGPDDIDSSLIVPDQEMVYIE